MSKQMAARLIVMLVMLGQVGLAQSTQAGQAPPIPSSTPPSPSESVPQPDAAIEQKTAKTNMLTRLDSLFAAAGDFPDEALGIKTQARIADMLWTLDEARSRKHFQEAYEAINHTKQNNQDAFRKYFVTRLPLRSNLLALIGRHDRKWADSLLQESFKLDTTEALPGFTVADQQSAIRLRTATETVQFDPESAAKVLSQAAVEGIDWKGISWSFFSGGLAKLRQQDKNLADDILIQALDSAQANPATDYQSLPNLVWCIWPVRFDQSDPRVPEVMRRFLTMAQPIIMRLPKDQEVFAPRNDDPLPDWSQMLVDFYDVYMPEAASVIHKKFYFVPPMEGTRRAWWYAGGESTRQHMDAAKNAGTDSEKDSIYWDSAISFARKGLIEDAFSAARNIRNERSRGEVETVIRTNAVEQAARRGDVEAAYRYAKEENGKYRLDRYIETMDAALGKKDREFAASLLREIENWTEHHAELRSDPRAWLKLTGVAAHIDSEHGFQVMRAAVRVINGFDSSGAGDSQKAKNQLQQNQPSRIPLKADGLEYSSFGLLADADSAQTFALAQDIQRKDVSVLAQLTICERWLAKDKEALIGEKTKKKTPARTSRDPVNRFQ